MNFVRGGCYNHSNGQLDVRGMTGYGWSVIAYTSTAAYYFASGAYAFSPQANNPSKGDGLSVRCVAKLLTHNSNDKNIPRENKPFVLQPAQV